MFADAQTFCRRAPAGCAEHRISRFYRAFPAFLRLFSALSAASSGRSYMANRVTSPRRKGFTIQYAPELNSHIGAKLQCAICMPAGACCCRLAATNAMTMSSSTHLNISAAAQENALSKEQKRFNTLIGKIEQYKQTLAALKTDITAFEIVFAHEYYPQVQAIDALKAQLIKQIDQVAGQTKLNKRLEKIIGRLIFDIGREILDADSEPALKAIFLYWCDIDLDQEHAAEKARAEQSLQDNPTAATDNGSPDIADTGQRGQSHFAEGNAEESADDAATAAENARQEHARRRQAAKQARIAQQEKAVSLSIREVYRKLASMLHPDREQDEQKRSEKNTLMQEVNAAYEARDLLSLLEMQRRLEQIDPQHLASLSKEKLQHYLQVLAEQEKELRAEIQFETNTFRQRFGIGNHDKISVQVNQLKKEAKTLQKMVSALERDLLILQKTGDISVMLSAFGY